MCTGMRIGMHTETCADMCVDMFVCRRVRRHVQTHACVNTRVDTGVGVCFFMRVDIIISWPRMLAGVLFKTVSQGHEQALGLMVV